MILGFLMVPVITEYRNFRTQINLSYGEAFFSALFNVTQNWFDQIGKGIEFVFFRMPGMECLWSMLARYAEPLGIYTTNVINQTDGIAGYLTHVIYAYPESDSQLFAPGFVGWFYLVAGLSAIIVGSGLLGILAVFGGKYLDRRYIETGPVAQVFFLWMLFLALTEGTLDGMVHMFIAGLITIISLEVVLRMIVRIKSFEELKI
jgi:hypothetical protein